MKKEIGKRGRRKERKMIETKEEQEEMIQKEDTKAKEG